MAKLAKRTIKKAHKLAEKLKGKRGIKNPYAVAMAAITKRRRG